MKNGSEMEKIQQESDFAVEHLRRLKEIVVYSTSNDATSNLAPFAKAARNGIQVIVPENRAKLRNGLLRKEGRV
jgi:translation initiation factor 2B subunit (eIF-2B alpha/beta/delta family)